MSSAKEALAKKKMKSHIRISSLTRSELEKILDQGNFTEEQERIFNLLNKDDLFDFGIMQKLGLSNRRYYDVKAVVLAKVERIARENGFIDSIFRQ